MMKLRPTLFTALAGLSLALSSCVVTPDHPVATASVGVGVYDTLPGGWDEPYYYHGGHYYYGGSWESGNFRYHGKVHTSRYRHNGHVYYGGRYDAGHHHHH